MTNLETAVSVIWENREDARCGIFDSRNILGDRMVTLYDEGDLQIDICYDYEYFEVFGLSDQDFAFLMRYYNEMIRAFR